MHIINSFVDNVKTFWMERKEKNLVAESWEADSLKRDNFINAVRVDRKGKL